MVKLLASTSLYLDRRVEFMMMTRIARTSRALSIALLVAGALVVTFTNLGILGWALTGAGIVVLIIAVTRPKQAQQ